MYFYTCPNCGAALDPGEKCDCMEIRETDTGISQERGKQDGERGLESQSYCGDDYRRRKAG